MSASTRKHRYWVYIVASKPHGTLYIGVTNSLERRIWEHKTGAIAGFTKHYGLKILVHFEEYREITDAIDREKALKGWLRIRKTALIRQHNPFWKDLAADWYHVQMDSSLRSE